MNATQPPAAGARVLILYNEPVLDLSHRDAESEHEILYTADAVQAALEAADFRVRRLGVCRAPQVLVAGLKAERPDVVFNLFEGLADDNGTEAHAAGVLEWMGIPFTGSPF